MTLADLVSAVQSDPWLFNPARFAGLRTSIESFLRQSEGGRIPEEKAFFFFDDESAPKSILSVDGGIGTVRISGPLSRNPHPLLKRYFGFVGFEDIIEAVNEAAADSKVKGILLDFDTPGGTVAGTPETGDVILEASGRKPVYAFSEGGMMASAGYWLGSQAHAVYATRSSVLGSIGVMLPVVDSSKVVESMGYKVTVVKTGKFKGTGYPGAEITDEQLAELQRRVDLIFDDFQAVVLSRGRAIPESAMQGQTFSGKDVEKNNLGTIVKDRAEVIARLKSFSRSRGN